jgi:hypothetical protein
MQATDTAVTPEHFDALSAPRFGSGDEFEIKVSRDGSDYEEVLQLTAERQREVGDRNGFLKATDADGSVLRFYVRDDGAVTISRCWSPGERVVQNMAVGHGSLSSPEYELVEAATGEIELREKSQVDGPSL